MLKKDLLIEGITYDDFIQSLIPIMTEIVSSAIRKQQGEKFLSIKETCKLFSPEISRGTLSNWDKDGLIPHHEIGGKPFYVLSEILEASTRIKRYAPTKTKLKVA